MQVHSPPCARGRSQLYKLRNEEQRERKRIHAAAEGARDNMNDRDVYAQTRRYEYGMDLLRPIPSTGEDVVVFVVS